MAPDFSHNKSNHVFFILSCPFFIYQLHEKILKEGADQYVALSAYYITQTACTRNMPIVISINICDVIWKYFIQHS